MRGFKRMQPSAAAAAGNGMSTRSASISQFARSRLIPRASAENIQPSTNNCRSSRRRPDNRKDGSSIDVRSHGLGYASTGYQRSIMNLCSMPWRVRGAQQQPVNQTKQGGAKTDACRQHQYKDPREAGALCQHAQTVSDVLQQTLHHIRLRSEAGEPLAGRRYVRRQKSLPSGRLRGRSFVPRAGYWCILAG